MKYALNMAIIIIRCFEILTMLTHQNIVSNTSRPIYYQKIIRKQKIIIGHAEPSQTKLNKTIIDILSFIYVSLSNLIIQLIYNL